MHTSKLDTARPGEASQTDAGARRLTPHEAWLEGESFYGTLLSVSPYSVTVTDLDGKITYVSQRAWQNQGYAGAEEMIGKSAFELIAPEHLELAQRNLQRTLVEGQLNCVEYLLRRQDGSTYWGELSAAVVRGADGRPVGFVATINDISSLKQTELALRESETRFRDLADLVPQVIYEMDTEGNLLFASRLGLERLGVDPARVSAGGLNISELLVPEDLERSRKNVRALFEGGGLGAHEYTIVNDLGERVAVAIYSAPVTRDGEVVGLRGVVIDISQRRRAQDELKRLNRELEQRVNERTAQLQAANQELEAFSYSVSHDLRSPLATIDGFSQALQEDYGALLDDTGREYIERLRTAGTRMGQLIDDLMQLAGVARSELQREQVDLSSLAQMVADRVCQSAETSEQHVSIQPDLEVRADARLLQVLLENLLANACKFSSEEPVAEIEVGARDQDTFYVRDNGVGFDVDQAEGLFQPFQRFHHADQFPGTGIGLATVQRVAKRHGGRVWIESAPGAGATVYFTLSVDSDPAAP